MASSARTVSEYLAQLSEGRKEPVQKLAETIKKNLPAGFEQTMSYGMIGFVVAHKIYPEGYHCDPKLPLPFINLGSQKNFIALYHMGIYAEPKLMHWFEKQFPLYSKSKLDMGKSCIRFKKMDDIPYKLIAELCKKITVNDWIAKYEENYKKRKI